MSNVKRTFFAFASLFSCITGGRARPRNNGAVRPHVRVDAGGMLHVLEKGV